MMNSPRKISKLHDARGFSVIELLIVTAVIAIIGGFAVVSFQRSKRSFDLSGASRTLAAYCEQARVDSIRRHGGANIVIDSATSYTVNMDFDGSGTTGARTVNLPTGTTMSYTLPPATSALNPSSNPLTITYDWRGRTTSAVAITLTDSISGVSASRLVVGSAGDISNDSTVTGPVTTPTPQNTTVTTTTGIKDMSGS